MNGPRASSWSLPLSDPHPQPLRTGSRGSTREMERDLGTQQAEAGEGLECADKVFCRQRGKGGILQKSGTPFLGKREWSWRRELSGIAGVHRHPRGQDPLLPPSLSLQNQSIWGGVTMATWDRHPETSEKVMGGVWKNGDQKPWSLEESRQLPLVLGTGVPTGHSSHLPFLCFRLSPASEPPAQEPPPRSLS